MSGHRWSAADVPVPAGEVCAAVLDGEAVLYDPIRARSLLLNVSLTAVWAAVDGVADVAEITEQMAARFGATAERIRTDVEAGLAALAVEGFVVRRGDSRNSNESLG